MDGLKDEHATVAVTMSPTTTNTTTSTTPEKAQSVLPGRYRWRPTFWRVRPLLGVVALLTTVICLLVSLAILKASNGDPTDNWYFQPTVYLAIATAISNAALQCALSQAAPISWWYKALKGSTVKDLELDWEAGQGFPRAFIKSYKYRRFVSLFSFASLATSLVLVDGPLLQRSSSVKRVATVDKISLNISLAPQLPAGFSLDINKVGNWENTPASIAVYKAHIGKEPMTSSTFCNGTCRATVRGPGYTSMGCRNQTWLINESILRDPNSTWGIGHFPDSDVADVMAPKPLLYSVTMPTYFNCDQGREPIFIATGIANYQDCQGNFTFSNCTMVPAVLEYDITIQGSTITYTSPTILDHVVALADDYCTNRSISATTGFVTLLYPFLTSNGRLGRWDNPPPGTHPIEVPATFSFSSFAWEHVDITPGNSPCFFSTHDPMDDIITAFNDVLFRAGLLVGSWPNIDELLPESAFPVHQTVEATRTGAQNIFNSDERWFYGAAAVQILTIILILPAYWGWWNIGVELTLSPFHTAKAFDAPLLKHINSAAGSMGVVDEVGETHLKLGAVEVRKFEQGAVDKKLRPLYSNRSRIGLDTPERVVRPLKGARFTD